MQTHSYKNMEENNIRTLTRAHIKNHFKSSPTPESVKDTLVHLKMALKVFLLVSKALNGLAPLYLSNQ